MAIVQVDVDLGDFSDSEIAQYVADDDARWAKCIAAREKEIARREGLRCGAAAWNAAKRDGLIREPQGAE